jgi:archaeosortase B (VPXXXP-CTERM-specific)
MSAGTKTTSSLKPVLHFLIKFVLFLALLALGFGLFKEKFAGVISSYLNATASLVRYSLQTLGFDVLQAGNVINLDKFSVQVILECAGIYQMLVFSAAVQAFPARPKQRILGILLAMPIFYLIDLLRIAVLLLVGNYQPKLFDFVHLYTGQIFIIFIVILVWLFWLKKIAHAGKTA